MTQREHDEIIQLAIEALDFFLQNGELSVSNQETGYNLHMNAVRGLKSMLQPDPDEYMKGVINEIKNAKPVYVEQSSKSHIEYTQTPDRTMIAAMMMQAAIQSSGLWNDEQQHNHAAGLSVKAADALIKALER